MPPRNTSRKCPRCGHVSADNWKTQATFGGMECGFEEHADLVAAINVLKPGHARCACEVNGKELSAAGTHRSDSCRRDAAMSAGGIPAISAGTMSSSRVTRGTSRPQRRQRHPRGASP